MTKPLTRLHTNGLQGTFLKQEKLLLRVKHNCRYELKCSETTTGYLRLVFKLCTALHRVTEALGLLWNVIYTTSTKLIFFISVSKYLRRAVTLIMSSFG